MEDIDDDFEDLYADVEVLASSAINGESDISQLWIENYDYGKESMKRVDSIGDHEAEKVLSSQANDGKEVIVDNGSDNEDDLNILLNNDNDGELAFPFTRGVNLRSGGFDDEENGGFAGSVWEVAGGLEQSLNGVDGGERGNGGKGGYHSQYKSTRHQSVASASNSKGNGCGGVGSNSSISVKGVRADNGFNQSGRNFFLPPSWTILDVNIDIFEQKPWRRPGADITDFFNFGFDEDSWKHCCSHLDQCHHGAVTSTRILASEHEMVAQEAVAGKIQNQYGRTVSPMSRIPCNEQKHSEKITVQDLQVDSSGSVKGGLGHIGSSEHQASGNGDLCVDDGRGKLYFSSASEAERHREYLDGNHEGLGTPVSKRCSQQTTACKPESMDSNNRGSLQISDADRHHHQVVAVCDSEGTAEAIETSNITKERIGRDTSNTELRESVTSDYHHLKESKSHGVKRKPGDFKNYIRYRSPIQEHLKHHDRRLHGVSGSKNQIDAEDTSPMSDIEGLYDVNLSGVGHSKQNGRFSDYQVEPDCVKNPHRKGHKSFGAETDRHPTKNLAEGEYLIEQRKSRVDDEVIARDWYHYESGHVVEDMGPLTCRESRQLNLKYFSHFDNDRGAQWKRKVDESQFRKRMNNCDFSREHKYTNNFSREIYKRPVPYNNRYRDYSGRKYGRQLPYTREEVKSPGRGKRRRGSPSIDFNLCSMGEEDEFWRFRDYRSLYSRPYKEHHTGNSRRCKGTMSSRSGVYERHGRHGKYRRQVWTERSRDSGWFGGYTDAFDTEESINKLDDRVAFGRGRHNWKSELLSRHRDDRFHAQAASFSFERNSRCKRFDAEYGPGHVGKLIDDRQVPWRRGKLIREGNRDDQFDSSNIIGRGYHEQTLQRCRDSADMHLVGGEGKSSGRCSNSGSVMNNVRHENTDQNVDLEQNSFNDLNESHTEKLLTQAETPKAEDNQNGENWLDKFIEAWDIEEGQIISEEINESGVENVGTSDDVAQMNKNATDGETAIEGYDDPWILDILAKMERRRERFIKDPITLEDSDKTLMLLTDSVDETAETK